MTTNNNEIRIFLVTSDSWVGSTSIVLESLRYWHPDVPIRVYALQQNWRQEYTDSMSRYSAEVKVMPEKDIANRKGGVGKPMRNIWKLDGYLDQDRPFIYLDSDMIVLKPLTPIFNAVRERGWFVVREGTKLSFYNQGRIAEATGMGKLDDSLTSFNSGTLGCDPAKHRKVFELAKKWADEAKVQSTWSGDQGLLNLAWYKLYGNLPEGGPGIFNNGVRPGNKIDLLAGIVHIAGSHWRGTGLNKLELQNQIWSNWPKGIQTVGLTDTEFWRSTLPHPWQWLNQANRKQHRSLVKDIRLKSRSLIGTPWLIIQNDDEAYLLHPDVLTWLDEFWKKEQHRLNAVPHIATYHLDEHNRCQPCWRGKIQRISRELISLVR